MRSLAVAVSGRPPSLWLPYRRPPPDLETAVVERMERIIETLKADPAADVTPLRDEIGDLIFDLFEVRSAGEEVRRFYRSVGCVERADEAAQAASE